MTNTRQFRKRILAGLAGSLLLLLSACSGGSDAPALELSSTQPSLLFFFIDN